MDRTELITYLNTYLGVNDFKDYGPQGLQVEADNTEIKRIALAVDSAPDVIDAAANWNADMLLVHHGILWRDVERIAGPLGKRVRNLLSNNINLYAAHLCLDAHPEVGNNAVLANMFGVEVTQWWADAKGVPIAVYGTIAKPIPRDEFVADICAKLGTNARLLAHGTKLVQNVAICSGFAADRAAEVKALGADTFITGETSHANYWAAQDYGLNMIYAGHYASETVGVQALGKHLEEKFGVETTFFDFPTRM